MLRPARSKKRMKLARQCKTKRAIPERRELLFDSLADSTTEDIVRLMAPTSKQKEEDWSSNIPADTVLALLKSGGSLRRVAKNIFRSIHFSIIANLFPNDSSVHVYGYYKDIAHLMLELPVELGEGIETLNISTPLVPAFTRAIAKQCTGLRNFSFAPLARIFPTVSFSSIMAARGPGLKFLGLTNFKGNEGMVNALSHCQSLEHLKISYPRGDFSFEPFWKSVGNSLQHLEILTFGEPLMFKLGALIRNCPNISQLAFDVDHREDEEDWYVEIEAVCQGYASDWSD